jgi:hypothetical protein
MISAINTKLIPPLHVSFDEFHAEPHASNSFLIAFLSRLISSYCQPFAAKTVCTFWGC